MDMVIQRATRLDAASILALQRLAYESEAKLYSNWSIPPLTQTLEELIAEFETKYFLKALVQGELVGSVRGEMQGATCEVGRLIVSPSSQRKGIGRRLMREIESAYPSARRFELFTGSRSEGNIRLYELLGYRQFKQKTLSESVTLVFMEKAPPKTAIRTNLGTTIGSTTVENEKLVALLEEIRDSQRQHLEEYRRVANEALALQKHAFEVQQNAVAQQKVAVEAQAKHLRLYRQVIVGVAVLVAAAIWFVAELV